MHVVERPWRMAVSFKTARRVWESIGPSPRKGAGVAGLEMRLGWVIVYVDDAPAAAEFYVRTFGLRLEFVAGSRTYAQLDTGPTKLAFASYEEGERNFPGGVRRAGCDGPPPNVEVTLVHEDVEAAYAQALEGGCTALAAPEDKPQGQRVAYVRDPFGTLVELATPL
jgi:catechol 2,3-dioxygenase-like lactoylglutathione lyase family enzyme